MTLDLPDAHVELFNREPHFAIVEKPCSLSTSIHPSIHLRPFIRPSFCPTAYHASVSTSLGTTLP